MYRPKLIAVLLLSAQISVNAIAAEPNKTAIAICEAQLYDCTARNSTCLVFENSTAFVNCTNAFNVCLNRHAYFPTPKAASCYLADNAWTNFYASIASGVIIFFFANIIFPMILKGGAKTITWASKVDASKYAITSFIGRVLLYLTDANDDGVVSAAEIVSPNTIIAFGSVTVPIYQYFDANNQQARCDFDKANPPVLCPN